MTKRTATVLTVFAAVVAVAAPVLAAIWQARNQGRIAEERRVLAYAQDVSRRTDSIALQINRGLDLLTKASASPCSEEERTIMREIDLGSSYIQAIGRMSGNRMVCSSLGTHGEGLDLGPPEVLTPTNSKIRLDVQIPTVPGPRFLVIERYGYAAIIHKDVPLDVTIDVQDVSLASFTVDRRILTSRGFIKPAWLDALGDRRETTLFDAGYLAAIVRSSVTNTWAVAAVPALHLNSQVRSFALVLVPIGVGAGLLLAFAVLQLARMQLALPAVIRTALRRNEFHLAYQPIVELETGRWVGAEALLRWHRPSGELVRPDLFVPAAEDSGLIRRVTERAVQLLTKDAAALAQAPDFEIAINLSPADLHSLETVDLLRRLARDLGGGRRNLVIEATERGFLNSEVAREVVRKIRTLGIRVAIDDFGTGYSSLSYLESFELDLIKIDRSFVETLGTEAATSHVVQHIIEMARSLKLDVVAEGVETEAQAAFLRSRGVKYAQGWLFARAMSCADLMDAIATNRNGISA